MARIDDYRQARQLAISRLSSIPFRRIAENTHFKPCDEQAFLINFLNRSITIFYPSFEFRDITQPPHHKDVSLQQQVLILHYMASEYGDDLTGKWISFREITGASLYHNVFVKRAISPLKKTFGQDPTLLARAAERLNARFSGFGDLSFDYNIFPRVPVRVILWRQDSEFPPEAAMLFDESINHILSPEDVATLSGMLTYKLIEASINIL